MITRGLLNNLCLFLQLQMAALFLSFIYTAKFYNPALSKNDSHSDTRQQYLYLHWLLGH